MSNSNAKIQTAAQAQVFLRQMIGGIFLLLFCQLAIFAQSANITTSEDQKTLIIGDAKESEILAFGKNVIIKTHAKGVFAFGGDITVEGTVDEDVAVIGGSIIQKEGALIGGDVIVIGGTYRAESEQPLRDSEKETVIIAVFEEEFRRFAQSPTEIFSPSLSWGFLGQRILSVLFWFLVTLGLTTISPGAVSRAVARFQISTTKILGIGLTGFLASTIGVILSLSFLPNYLNVVILPMVLILFILAYVLGRVSLQVSLGKMLQKRFLPENRQSETFAILIGVIAWTIILSLPYVWVAALVTLFSASIGIVLTARQKNSWQKA